MQDSAFIPPLRIGLVLDSCFGSKYVYDLVDWVQTEKKVEVTQLLIKTCPCPRDTRRDRLLTWLRDAFFSVLSSVEDFFAKKVLGSDDHYRKFDINKVVPHKVLISAHSEEFVNYPFEEDVKKVQALKLDLIVNCASALLGGPILSASRLGVISCQYGDNPASIGAPAGFWEVYERKQATNFTIRRLATEPEKSFVLRKGAVPTKYLFGLTRAILYKKSTFFLKQLVSQIVDTGVLPRPLQSYPCPSKLSSKPTLLKQFAYLLKTGATISEKAVNYFFIKKEFWWSVCFQRVPWNQLNMSQAIKIENPPGYFLADPFVLREGNKDYCFVEEFNSSTNRGHITAYRLHADYAERLGEIIVEPFHMSFPYVFRFGGKLYICPETNENNDIRLYECEQFPTEWKLSKILMSGFSAVDTMIFQHGGLWWLFTNIDSASIGDYSGELHIFYSQDPVNGAWTPHPHNPIQSGSLKARNGGLIVNGEGLFRISQERGFEIYGRGFSINKIITLTTEEYVEKEEFSTGEDFFPNIIGAHHLHSSGDLTVFDCQEWKRRTQKRLGTEETVVKELKHWPSPVNL